MKLTRILGAAAVTGVACAGIALTAGPAFAADAPQQLRCIPASPASPLQPATPGGSGGATLPTNLPTDLPTRAIKCTTDGGPTLPVEPTLPTQPGVPAEPGVPALPVRG
ncbi:hypothetical protein [Amycolatopsis jejuensis]|uniref:hypothetical protein n=1 Tax=Amycolatopsis jejuensis TaxID=330084 RepID=UPI000527E451|nr:hypothetical protein [Amycolatopsis jejuensis]